MKSAKNWKYHVHEVSLVSAIVDQVSEAARKQSFKRVKKICLAIGAASGVDPDSIEFCFNEVARGSVLEGSRLEITKNPLQIICNSCGAKSESEELIALQCPKCDSLDVKVLSGKEFLILDLEVI